MKHIQKTYKNILQNWSQYYMVDMFVSLHVKWQLDNNHNIPHQND